MEHKVSIMSNRKVRDKSGFGFLMEDHITITEADVEELAMEKFKESKGSLDDTREYKATLDETRH